jgi:hypothetical protein
MMKVQKGVVRVRGKVCALAREHAGRGEVECRAAFTKPASMRK